MSYQVIARKFRPLNFDELQGQEHISRTIKRAIESGRIHHAYLFTGGRGVGKTSTARILAKALNCIKGPTISPCGECKSCQEITQGISLDVREIDGASNTGVDDVRQIREDVRYLPTAGKYRIYIIDEVHMLSTSAFNALLKTLEEPPAHVIFIFATTEPHKILDTILSRCQRYDFRLLSHTQIIDQLRFIAEKEGLKITDPALHLLAREAAGSMRDAQTLLEQVLPYADGPISEETVTQTLGLIDRKIIWETLQHLIERNAVGVLQVVRALNDYGHDFKHFAQDLLTQLRNLSIVQTCQRDKASVKDLLDLPDDDLKLFETLAPKLSGEETQRLYRILSDDFFHLTHAAQPRMALEMTLLRLVQSPPLLEISQMVEDLKNLKSKGGGVAAPAPSMPAPQRPVSPPAVSVKPASAPVPTPTAAPAAAPTGPLWNQLIDVLKSTHRTLASSLGEITPVTCTPEKIIIGVPPQSFLHETVKELEHQTAIIDAVQKITGVRPVVTVQVIEGMKGPRTESQARAEERKKLSEDLKDHPAVKDLQTLFGAEIQDVRHIKE